MYLSIRYLPAPLAGQSIFPNQARALISKALVEQGFKDKVDPVIFQRNEDGKTRSGQWRIREEDRHGVRGYGAAPHVYFSASKGALELTGVGTYGVGIVKEAQPLILEALSAQYDGAPIETKQYGGRCKIMTRDEHPDLFHIRRMILSKNLGLIKGVCPDGQPLEDEAANTLIANCIYSGLVSQAKLIDGQGDNTRAAQIEDYLPDFRSIEIDVINAAPTRLIHIDRRFVALTVDSVTFSMRVHLKGPWYAGKLRNHGYGRIWPGASQ